MIWRITLELESENPKVEDTLEYTNAVSYETPPLPGTLRESLWGVFAEMTEEMLNNFYGEELLEEGEEAQEEEE
jgi:hypothetical protein